MLTKPDAQIFTQNTHLKSRAQNIQKKSRFLLTFDKMVCIITTPFEKGPESDLDGTGRIGGRELDV